MRIMTQPRSHHAECRLIQVPDNADPKGNLAFVEGHIHIPFAIARVFYIHHLPQNARRTGHALRTCEQFIIAASGSFDVVTDNRLAKHRFHLARPSEGLYVPALVWRQLERFSSASICLVLASEKYDEQDYYRSYAEYLAAVSHR
jgi:uncharacterized RmlC-like cupin family protein